MTDRYWLWQQALTERDQGMMSLFILAIALVVSYLVTYVPWLPQKYGKVLRKAYEVGGVLLYIGVLLVSAM